jgi:predicted DsbA family dithiol-disulfide isomerase
LAIPVTIFSDFTCPFSYVTEAALWTMEPEIEVHTRAYELFPEPTPLDPLRLPDQDWRLLEVFAAELELPLTRVGFRPRTRKAHEAAWFSREQTMERRFRREVFRAYWSEERDIGRVDVLADLGGRAGLDVAELKVLLDIDRYQSEVTRDQEVGRRLRIPGTPTIFIGSGRDATVMAGARSPAELRSSIETAVRDGRG